ncbi:hypothetical protein ANN_13486 [Periplaneta americana]|uniref:Tc1-like transposase DDE domain-containing protein n=1 Tax=Periplaneta americana TaxID=6978 RepID=A0ABQ8TJJ8_PERAM|nr:hypothetical protein ANN_13486 [Periplaneta americana]
MAGLCEGGNEPSGSLKAICTHTEWKLALSELRHDGPLVSIRFKNVTQATWRTGTVVTYRANRESIKSKYMDPYDPSPRKVHHVCFSDESTIQILADKSVFVRRRKIEKYYNDCIMKTVKHPLSLMVWSVINGHGRLYFVQGMMRQYQYIKVLKERLLPQVREWFPDGYFVFMHDSAPCHKANKVTKFLSDNNIKVLDWPGNSPDLNPIENTRELMKRQIHSEIIKNKQSLIEKLINV